MSENSEPVKTKQYLGKDIDSMSADELRHGALKWLEAEAKGEGRGDEKAARASQIKVKVMGGGGKKPGRKALLARIEQLEQKLKG
jgi:hypothetical protein